MSIPKFVRYIGHGEGGVKYRDIVKVLSEGNVSGYLYVESPERSGYNGQSTSTPEKLIDKNFIFITPREYELINEEVEEEKKAVNKFKVGDIVCGNRSSMYSFTNSDMYEGKVLTVYKDGTIFLEVINHKDASWNGHKFGSIIETGLDPNCFDLVTTSGEDKSDDESYYFITDMKTFVNLTHNNNKVETKCNLNCDEFDIHYGINLALERLDEVEHPEKFVKELPKYVKYVGGAVNGGGLVKGDICKVLSGCIDEGDLYVVVPNHTSFEGSCALNPENLVGYNFAFLLPQHYESVNVYG